MTNIVEIILFIICIILAGCKMYIEHIQKTFVLQNNEQYKAFKFLTNYPGASFVSSLIASVINGAMWFYIFYYIFIK
jgi:hypothetical protein